jgi:Putative lumazine-binding
MRKRTPFIACTVLGLFGTGIGSPGALHAQAMPEAAVRAVVTKYLHGLKFNDVASFKAAFWPEAKLFWVKRDSTVGQLTQEEWYKGFVGSAGKEEAGELGIVSVNITDNAASVKVLETYPTDVYVDYLNLLRINGEWRIVNKIYTSRKR